MRNCTIRPTVTCHTGMERRALKLAAMPPQEFRKVFKPHACELHAWNASHFEECLAGRRIIIIGDSTMRQAFQSLACLMSDQILSGFFLVSLLDLQGCVRSIAFTPAAESSVQLGPHQKSPEHHSGQ